MNEVSRCQHLTLGGARCTYPSLLNKEFCYDHEHRRFRRRRRRVPILPDPHEVAGPLVTFVYMEDYASILENINNIALAFSENFIDHRQVSSLTYLMNTAVKTVDRMESLQKLRKEDMPRQVAYDDMENPIAPPDGSHNCHPESASAGEGPAVAVPNHQPDCGCPTLAAPAFGASRVGMNPAEGEPCPPDPKTVSEPVPAQPTQPQASPNSETETKEARHARWSREADVKYRKMNPWLYRTEEPARDSQAAGSLDLKAAAEPESPFSPDSRLPTPCISNNLPTSQPATNPESDTCTLRPSATTADSTLATLRGVPFTSRLCSDPTRLPTCAHREFAQDDRRYACPRAR